MRTPPLPFQASKVSSIAKQVRRYADAGNAELPGEPLLPCTALLDLIEEPLEGRGFGTGAAG